MIFVQFVKIPLSTNLYGMNCRGVKASCSFSFLEVVVCCDIADTESTSGDTASCSENKRSIYLHLKKFFRGARFTSYGFLRSLEGKHNEGDIVCVSGKVSGLLVLYRCCHL